MGGEIVHPAGYINELPVAQAFAHFLDGAMNITKVRLYFFNGFSFQGDHQVEDAVCGRVLRTQVDHQFAGSGIGQSVNGISMYDLGFPVHV